MRTKKKNESGILNQSLCSSNEGYKTYKKGDPKGSGITFACLSYPGARYNRGSVFREKDIGNLIQLIFEAGDYFRFKNIELIADSHFGHLTPIAFLFSWGVSTTCSFNAKARIGVRNIKELSKETIEKNEAKRIIDEELSEKSDDQKFDPLASSSESEEEA